MRFKVIFVEGKIADLYDVKHLKDQKTNVGLKAVFYEFQA